MVIIFSVNGQLNSFMSRVSGSNQSSDPDICHCYTKMYELLARLYKDCMNSECKRSQSWHQDHCFKLSQKHQPKEWKRSPDVSETEAMLTWEDQLHTRVRRRQHEIMWRHHEQGLFGPLGEKRFHPPSNIEQNQSFCILCFPLITCNWSDEHFLI